MIGVGVLLSLASNLSGKKVVGIAAGVAVLVLVSGIYIKGRSDGRALAEANCQTRVAEINAEIARQKEELARQVAERQKQIDAYVDRYRAEAMAAAAEEEDLRSRLRDYEDYLQKQSVQPECMLNEEDVRALQ